ncbi:MAG: hypothetical protein Q4G43_03120 [Mobilicoccus sp.]|nr:hypothetical protein [Mobilicoccus sp.]
MQTVMDQHLRAVLEHKGWVRRGTRRFIGETHLVDVLPGSTDSRITIFFGRCRTPGDPHRLTQCSRLTFTGVDELDSFLRHL